MALWQTSVLATLPKMLTYRLVPKPLLKIRIVLVSELLNTKILRGGDECTNFSNGVGCREYRTLLLVPLA